MPARPAADHRARRVRGGGGSDLALPMTPAGGTVGDDVCETHDFWHGVETLLTEELQTMTFAALTDARRRASVSSGRRQATGR